MPARLTEKHRKRIASLNRKKGRVEHGQFLVEGWRAVHAAVTGGAPLIEILVSERMLDRGEVADLCEKVDVPVFRANKRDINAISAVENDQGILAVARVNLSPAEALLGAPKMLVLDGVQDPGNVGTMIRTAAWFGIKAILTDTLTADIYNPKVVRATMGGIWDVELARTADLDGALTQFKADGFALYGADLDGTPAESWEPATPAALIIGSEAKGISGAKKAMLDDKVTVRGAESRRATESLNAAVAAGILMQRWE